MYWLFMTMSLSTYLGIIVFVVFCFKSPSQNGDEFVMRMKIGASLLVCGTILLIVAKAFRTIG